MSLHKIFYRYPENFPLPLVLDGSTGTSLMAEGMPAGVCTEKWVLENPEVIKQIQSHYIENGSDAVYAPTFGANRPTLERHGIEDCDGINTSLAKLSIGCGVLVGGDMSPTGLFIEPFGDTPFEDVVSVYKQQAKALHNAGVDFFICETNISLQEARAAVIGIREVSDKPVFVTMTVDEDGFTLGGDSLACCLLSLAELGISAFGTNCSQGPEGMLHLLRELVPMSLSLGIPLIAKPNAGMPHEDSCGCRHFDLSAEDFAKFVPDFLTSGIPIMGGCCGTDEKYIKAIRRVVDNLSLDYSQIIKNDTTNFASTTRVYVPVNCSELPTPILADENFFDNAMDMVDNGCALIFVKVDDDSGVSTLLEAVPMLSVPLAIAGCTSAISKVARQYAGKLYIIK